MRTTIDKAGRVVIPREIRERAGLGAGGEVDIQLEGAAIMIEATTATDIREESGFLVVSASGATLDDTAVHALIDADRDARPR